MYVDTLFISEERGTKKSSVLFIFQKEKKQQGRKRVNLDKRWFQMQSITIWLYWLFPKKKKKYNKLVILWSANGKNFFFSFSVFFFTNNFLRYFSFPFNFSLANFPIAANEPIRRCSSLCQKTTGVRVFVSYIQKKKSTGIESSKQTYIYIYKITINLIFNDKIRISLSLYMIQDRAKSPPPIDKKVPILVDKSVEK